MRILVVHLSDIHFKEKPEDNSLPARVPALANAILSISRTCDGILLITSGDVAFSGKDAEYATATEFYSGLTGALKTGGVSVLVHEFIPGNHDCNLDLSNSARASSTATLLTTGVNGDGSLVNTCTPVQAAFFRFREKECGHPVPAIASDALITSVIHDLAGVRCEVHLLNTAFCSTNPEKPGELVFPRDITLPDHSGASAPALVIAVLHHPYNWLEPTMAHALRDKLENTCDLVLTGHEHTPGIHHNTDVLKAATLDYLEGSVLQDNDDSLASGFHGIVYDLDSNKQTLHRFDWDDETKAYGHAFEAVVDDSLRNRRRLSHQFQPSSSFRQKMEDPGIAFSHPNCADVKLGGLYVFPDLQPFDVKAQKTRGNILPSSDLDKELFGRRTVLVLGSTQSGKTALSKALVRSAMSFARVPVHINGTELVSVTDQSLHGLIEKKIRESFEGDQCEAFWQQAPANRVLIVDDYHKCRLNQERKTMALDYFEKEFGSVVLVGNNSVRLNELLDAKNESDKLWTYDTFQIEELTLSLRHVLINKWVSLRDGKKTEQDGLETRAVEIERTITTVFGNDLVPSFPVYVLLILQQLTGKSQASGVTGSFGFLYEVLLTDGLSSRELRHMNLDGKYTYLSILAWRVLNSDERVLSREQFRLWHAEYAAKFNSLIAVDDAIEHFQQLNILLIQDGEVEFKYPYIFAFFVARYIRDHIGDEGMNALIEKLARQLYHEESARIVLFLCHHVKSTFLLEILVKAANEIFPGKALADLGQKELLFLSTLQPQIFGVDTGQTIEQNRLEHLGVQDAEVRRQQLARREESAARLQLDGTTQLNDAAQLTAALKSIQILGQVVRNFSGSLTGQQQEELIETIYNLGCRSMKVTLDAIEKRNEELIKRLVEVIGKLLLKTPSFNRMGNLTLTPRELQDLAQLLVERVAEFAIGGVIRHVADSAGSSDLETAINHVLAKKDSNAVHLIDLAIRLDHYREFPKHQVKNVFERIRKIPFALELFNGLLRRAFYLFPRSEPLKQEIQSKYGIKFGKKTFDPNLKKRLGPKALPPAPKTK
jgi:hypothetical protein